MYKLEIYSRTGWTLGVLYFTNELDAIKSFDDAFGHLPKMRRPRKQIIEIEVNKEPIKIDTRPMNIPGCNNS